jgi:hypothetical protein
MKADVKDQITVFYHFSGYTPAFEFFVKDDPDYYPFHIFYP